MIVFSRSPYSWFEPPQYFGGSGITDDGPTLRAALAQLNAMGGGTLQLLPGVYQVTPVPHPTNPAFLVGLVMYPNVKIQGAAEGTTIIRLAPNAPDQCWIMLNNGQAAGGDENMQLVDLTFDGNSPNQNNGVNDAQVGVEFRRARRVHVTRCRFVNVFGTTGGGNGPHGTPGEGTHLSFQFCTDVEVTDSHVVCTDSQTSSGFTTNGTTNASYKGCTASGLALGQGFSFFQSQNGAFHGCHAYLNGGSGFNFELSSNVSAHGCTAGGASSSQAGYPFPANTTLGNTKTGFNCRGSNRVTLAGCESGNNGSHGIAFYFSGSGLRVVGGKSYNNALWGLLGDGTQSDVVIEAHPLFSGNTSGQITLNNGTTASNNVGSVPAPTVPANNTALANPYPFACQVALTGGTVTAIKVDSVQVGTATPQLVYLPAWSQITLTYSVAPTWVWVAS